MNLFDKVYKSALIGVNENITTSPDKDYSNKFLATFTALPENERANFIAALTNYNTNAKSNLKSTIDPVQASSLKDFLNKYHLAPDSDSSESEETNTEKEAENNQSSPASNLTPSNIVV